MAIRRLRNLLGVSVFFLFVFSSCATYYTLNRDFNTSFEEGEYREALRELKGDGRRSKRRDRFAFYLDKGLTYHLLGEWVLSNTYLERAYLFGEDHTKSLLSEAVSALLPKGALYLGEDFEHILPLYYKVLNHVFVKDFEAALVECRRIDLRSELLLQKYKSPRKFSRDAFVHLLMGVIYEVNKRPNDAFIAYRNAHEIYTKDYDALFGMLPPEQLVKDMARTAYLSGLYDEYHRIAEEYEKAWVHSGPVYDPKVDRKLGHVVFFWNNGLGPYKSESNFTFVDVDGVGGVVSFTDERNDIVVPYSAPPGAVSDFVSFRASFPKYVERPVYYRDATVWVDGVSHDFELAEDVNAIAFRVLRQRMVYEASKLAVRMAAKEIAKSQIRRAGSSLGILADLIFLFTEHTDTRGWQTSPHAIHYARLPLAEGKHEVKIELFGDSEEFDKSEVLSVRSVLRETRLYAYSSMQTEGL